MREVSDTIKSWDNYNRPVELLWGPVIRTFDCLVQIHLSSLLQRYKTVTSLISFVALGLFGGGLPLRRYCLPRTEVQPRETLLIESEVMVATSYSSIRCWAAVIAVFSIYLVIVGEEHPEPVSGCPS